MNENYTIQLFFECIAVGTYCLFLFSLLQYFNLELKNTLFLLGFSKHFIGYFLGFHSVYCQYGANCQLNRTPYMKIIHYEKIVKNITIIGKSIIEGFVFLFIGWILFQNGIKNNYINVFFIGFFLHILSDIIGFHTYICRSCTIQKQIEGWTQDEIEDLIVRLNSWSQRVKECKRTLTSIVKM